MKYIFLLLLIISCSGKRDIKQDSSYSRTYLFKDPSGQYRLKRDVIEKGSKIQLRQQLFSMRRPAKPLEKAITISQIGTLKTAGGNITSIRPYVSQFSIWFEKNRYFTQFKLNERKRAIDIIMRSPDKRWNKTISKKFPKGSVFCWFSQIPECLKRAKILTQNKTKEYQFIVIWESYPYYTEQYQNVPTKIFSNAVVKYDGVFQKNLKYNVQIGDQLLIYHFSSKLTFEKMFWISQGISIVGN